MAHQNPYPTLETLRKLEASLSIKSPAPHSARRSACNSAAPQISAVTLKISNLVCKLRLFLSHPRLRKAAMVAAISVGVVFLGIAGLGWRLASGPIAVDVVTPWISAAIKQNFGPGHEVDIGGTQLERTGSGRTSLRIRDIVVRDAQGIVVASAPKAEVGISGWGLLTGRIRAERLSLVGAEMAIRVETDSTLTVFAGGDRRPFVTAAAAAVPVITGSFADQRSAPIATIPVNSAAAPAAAGKSGGFELATLLAWIETLDAGALDGRDLNEIGLKGGNLSVDDQRTGKQWTFANIDLSVTRPKDGGVALTLGSQGNERPWQIRAAITPGAHGHRIVDLETQKVSVKDVLFAMRWGEGMFEADLPVSARVRADVGPDGMPHMLEGRVVVEKGVLIDVDDPLSRVAIDRAELNVEWDASRQAIVVPVQIVSGTNKFNLVAQADPPSAKGGVWGIKISGGSIALASATAAEMVVLNRVLLKLHIDPANRRMDVKQGDIGNSDLSVAISGGVDFSGEDPRLALGITGTRMSVATLKKLWWVFAAPKVRAWVDEHIASGTVERVEIATNAPMSTLRESGPPVPEDGLAVKIIGHGTELRPVDGIPAIRDADIDVRISGRTAVVNVGRGNVELPSGRKLSITNGVFEVPDTFPKGPPAKVRFRLDGAVPAAAELLALERLREYCSSTPVDPATSRGTITAQVTLGLPLKNDLPPGSTNYAIGVELTNFAADHMIMGQKIEAASLKVNANNQGQWMRGDVKINGIPAALDLRKTRDADPEIRVQAVLDENARSKLGFDVGTAVVGQVPIKLSGRLPAHDGDNRLTIEADLTAAKVDNLLPGWSKPAGDAARATFVMINKPQQLTRLEDLAVESANVSVRGVVELDANGDVLSATFPVFNFSGRDKTTLKADRGADGALRVIVRGEVFDARSLLKGAIAGGRSSDKKKQTDVDLDVKLGTVAGFHGEALRAVELRLSRRGGVITALALHAKLGRDTAVLGDLRGRGTNGRQVVYLETADAGAFLRFMDIYAKAFGGMMWLAIDPQSADQAPQEGLLNVTNFAIRGEPALERVAAAPQQPGAPSPGVDFTRMRVEFSRSLGRFTVHDGLVKGMAIGGTIDGYIDYAHSDVRMRGTFVPLYGINNMFGQIPIVGLFLGGSNEGLIGVTYEVVGPPDAPVLRVNPISAVAPGLLRKFFEFPSGNAAASPNGTAPVMPYSYAEPR
jgi:hypothetical protein